jgi:transcription antitermination factor NusG
MPEILTPAPPGAAWVVVHARPRCEKRVAATAGPRGFPVYLPLRNRSHRYGGRLRTHQVPLFTGYVFVCGDLPFQQWLRQNRHVARLIPVLDEDALLAQLRQIQLALDAGAAVEVLPFLEVGRRVKVGRGPLKGLEGLVQSHKGRMRLVVTLDIIRESVAVEIDSDLLDPA